MASSQLLLVDTGTTDTMEVTETNVLSADVLSDVELCDNSLLNRFLRHAQMSQPSRQVSTYAQNTSLVW